jgi:hypothetical protein
MSSQQNTLGDMIMTNLTSHNAVDVFGRNTTASHRSLEVVSLFSVLFEQCDIMFSGAGICAQVHISKAL